MTKCFKIFIDTETSHYVVEETYASFEDAKKIANFFWVEDDCENIEKISVAEYYNKIVTRRWNVAENGSVKLTFKIHEYPSIDEQ